MATLTAEDPTNLPSINRVPSAPSRPALTNAGRPLLRRLDSSAGGLFKPPTLNHLKGRWHITHSTLPIWKDKRNVTISYSVLPDKGRKGDGGESSEGDEGLDGCKLEDVIEYQEQGKSKVHTVKGIDTISPDNNTSSWNWRGKGIIKIASSHWEVLGWGVDDGFDSLNNGLPEADLNEKINGTRIDSHATRDVPHERQWMVTYFAKTYFTPAGMDIYSRHPDGVSEKLFEQIRQTLREIDAPHLNELAVGLYQVGRDGGREF